MRTAEGSGPAYVVILGRFVTNIGFFMVIPFLAVYVTQQEGMNSLQAGGLLAALEFTRRGLGVFAGWISDRFGAARMISVGLAVEVVGYLGFASADRSYASWLGAVAVLGLGGALNNNSARSLLASVRERGNAVVNLSRYYVSINGAALIGPLIGSALIATGQVKAGFVVAALLHLVIAAATLVLLRGVPPVEGSDRIRPVEMAAALRDRPMVLCCLLAVGGWLLITQYRVALPLTVVHQGLSADLVGVLVAGNAVVVIVAVALIGNRIQRRDVNGWLDVLSLSGVVLGGGWLLCAIPGLGPIVAAVVVTSIGESLFCGVFDAVISGMAPPGRVGLYLGYSTMAWGLGGVVGGLLGGAFDVAADHGALIVFWLVLALIGVGSGAGVWLLRGRFASALLERQAALAEPA
jgi:DHA1 family multidrug resistance protein-like MFS transporter